MICSKCGNQLQDDALFCPRCGATTGSETPDGNTQSENFAPFTPEFKPVNEDEHVSVPMWIGIFLINIIPCVGPLIYIVMLFVWAFGNNNKTSLKNFAKAQLIVALAVICLAIVALLFVSILNIGVPGSWWRRNLYYYNPY